jgi:hypothetical protein
MLRHIWTFSDPHVVYDSVVGVLPGFAGMLAAGGQAARGAFRSAIIQAIRQKQGDGPYGLEGEAHIAVGVK